MYSHRGNSSNIVSIAISPDGRSIVSGSSDEVKIWDAEPGDEVRCFIVPCLPKRGLVCLFLVGGHVWR